MRVAVHSKCVENFDDLFQRYLGEGGVTETEDWEIYIFFPGHPEHEDIFRPIQIRKIQFALAKSTRTPV